MRSLMSKTIVVLSVAIAMNASTSLAAARFQGEWKVKDTAGKPFEITLSENGTAKATRGEGMSGTWKEQGGAAIITWDTGWVTKIAKEGTRYKKTAFRKGQRLDSAPANSSEAEKTD